MDDVTWLQLLFGLSAGLGLAAACGMRVFLPMFVAALGVRFLDLPAQDGFGWLGSTPSLIGLGTATVLEIGAYYVPWLDNLLDSLATPSAVVAGVLTSAAVMIGLDPFAQWTLAIVAGGGAAGTVQLGTVATRAVSTGTTAGLGNALVATLENGAALVLSLLAVFAAPLALIAVIAALWLAVGRLRAWRRPAAV